MFEAGLFVETFLPLFILSAYKNSVHCKSIAILVNHTRSRVCMKNHSRNLHAPFCGIFCSNSVVVASVKFP